MTPATQASGAGSPTTSRRKIESALPGLPRASAARAMVERGFTPVQALRTITALSHYITGHVLQEQAVAATAERAERPDLSELPTLAAALRAGSPIGDEVFEHGLATLIKGRESLLRP